MKSVIDFLNKNGFKKIEKNSYANNKCNVVINKLGYEVANNNGDAFYSSNLNIYWLIGILTYYGYMKKDYIS